MSGGPRPRARIEGGDELRAAARDLVAEVDAALPYLTSRADLMPRHFAALGLARANRLLKGILTLYDNGLADAGGVLLRPILEVMLYSLYSLFGEEPAYDEIRGEYVREVGNLADVGALAEAKRGLTENWTGTRDRIPIEQLAARVGQLLADRGDAAASGGTQLLYDLLYRGASLTSIHGGLGAVNGHLLQEGERLAVVPVRREIDDGTADIVVGAAHLAMLAHHVLAEFGVRTDRVDEIFSRLSEGTGPENLVIEDDPPTLP